MPEKSQNLAWLIFARLLVVSLFLGSISYFNYRQPGFFPDEMLRAVTRLIIVTYGLSIVSLLAIRLVRAAIPVLGYVQIIWETAFVSILIVITGGITSTYAFFYNLAIINASYLFGRRESLITAGFCGVIYGLILDLHYFGRMGRFGLLHQPGDLFSPNIVLSQIFVNLLAFFLTAILTGYLAERAKKSETALKEKVIDYQELERVNGLIVATLDSGLVTVTSDGRIRVFNKFASDLTGIDQEAAYNLTLTEIFPDIQINYNLKPDFDREEFHYKTRTGALKILGSKSAPLQDRNGKMIGAVIEIKDLTEIRTIEAKLKKTDRLAAIGELSARIAHEVRNPLASISGSVQLLAESGDIPDSDRKLMSIVLRETARLDNMLSEFLQYARPLMPAKSWFSIKRLTDELVSLITKGAQFSNIIIENFTEPVDIYADHDQFRQMLWNLILNSAEAMPEGGRIRINTLYDDSPTPPEGTRSLKITIEDNGAGIDAKHLDLLFEPFFTTKAQGTGLGLAIVYRILENHGATISVASTVGNGTCFTIIVQVPQKHDDLKSLMPPNLQRP